jgi:hypothetical protein
VYAKYYIFTHDVYCVVAVSMARHVHLILSSAVFHVYWIPYFSL